MKITKPKRIPYAEYKKIYSKVPRITVEVFLVKDKKILLTKRTITPAKGKWHTPGGAVLMGEKLDANVKRVAKEELGVDIKIEKMVDVIEYSSFHKEYFGQDVTLAFLCSMKKPNQAIVLDDGASDFEFFETLPKNMIPEQRKSLKEKLGFE